MTDRSAGTRSAAPGPIALDAGEALSRAPSPRALVGFDGFLDTIAEVVDQREGPEAFRPIATIREFAERIAGAAGKSTNLEVVSREVRFGGNGPLMASGLAALGAGVSYVGAIGREDEPTRVHPAYEALEGACERCVPIGPPARTDALEFTDGKVMLNHPRNVQHVDWDTLRARVGIEALREMCAGASILGIVNWVMMAGVESIWRGLARDVLPHLAARTPLPAPRAARRAFVDLCDPAKRTDEDVGGALALLQELDRVAPVTLGLNLAEAQRVARVLGGESPTDSPGSILAASMDIRERTGLACVVIHPRHGAAGADASGSAWIDGPFTHTPRLSTGAGDHFNAGFAFAQACGMPLAQCLACACATSGAYVRDAASPSRGRVVEMLRTAW
jgi:sugar/nucleoside kinase (ribokinase family)